MYFPSDMTAQYFLFDTYPGYFLQVLPLALLAAAVYGAARRGRDGATPLRRSLLSCLFVCYITGLVCLVLAIDVISMGWYWLLYRMPSGIVVRPFVWDCNFIPDFWNHLDGEMIGNFILFLPFGVLYPLSRKASWGRTALAGFLTSLAIELFQPAFGRAFDINDILLNTLGALASASAFFLVLRCAGERIQGRF